MLILLTLIDGLIDSVKVLIVPDIISIVETKLRASDIARRDYNLDLYSAFHQPMQINAANLSCKRPIVESLPLFSNIMTGRSYVRGSYSPYSVTELRRYITTSGSVKLAALVLNAGTIITTLYYRYGFYTPL